MSTSQGIFAEQLAARFLGSRGVRVEVSNYRCKLGEIDLVAMDGETLCFVEVRFRRSAAFGTPIETVNRQKQKRIAAAARHFLAFAWKGGACACRFDIVTIDGPETEIRWWRSAFLDE